MKTTAVALSEDRPTTVAIVRPVVTPAALVEAHKEVVDLIAKVLERGRDYGTIPGTNRSALHKPGAERLTVAFGTQASFEVLASEVDHDREASWTKRRKTDQGWQEESGKSTGLYRYVIRCTLTSRADGTVVGEGIGSCSTLESKYVDRPRDSENTVLKMAAKRAHVAAVLTAFGLSDRFDEEEGGEGEDGRRRGARRGSAPAQQGAGVPSCPVCGGAMWDNRGRKRNPNAPDFRCRDRQCDGAIWPDQHSPAEEDGDDGES